MSGTSVAAAIDYLVDKCLHGFTSPPDTPGGARAIPALTAVDKNVQVTDGPAGSSSGPWVTIGFAGPQQDTAIPVTIDYKIFGRRRIDEEYTLLIDIITNGPEDQQSATRLAAAALHDAVVLIVWGDPTLGGVLQNGRSAHVAQAAWIQPPASTGSGTAAAIQLSVSVKNSYNP